MNTDVSDLSLDLERCHKVQEITKLMEQLMAAEGRSTAEYVAIRHKILDAAEQLYKVSLIYLELIDQRQVGVKH